MGLMKLNLNIDEFLLQSRVFDPAGDIWSPSDIWIKRRHHETQKDEPRPFEESLPERSCQAASEEPDDRSRNAGRN